MNIGALEAGGTKMVCAIGNERGDLLDIKSFPTESPSKTMPILIDYFRNYNICALGIGCFGPLDLNKSSDSYGYIKSTPKKDWREYNIVGSFKSALNIPIGFDTDVNASVLGEIVYGSARGLNSCVYITIGTGIGAGIYSENKLLHNMLHPEAGHIFINKHPDDTFDGCCPYHSCCFEGLASGPSIEARYGKKASELTLDNKVWELEAYYIAQALINYILILSPNKIILGGGVMHQLQLFPLIRYELKKLLNEYIITKEIEDLDNYIVPSSLDGNQGILGCIELAKTALF